jgi:acetyl esterase/lipase
MHVQLAEAGITVYTIDYMGEVFKKGYKTTHPHAKNMVLEVYQGLVAEGHLDPKTTTWLGDSAAGHLNLVAMDALVNDPKYSGLESPAHMFLISPFSDPMVTGETALNPANGFVILGRRIRMCMDVLRGEKPMYDRDVTPLLNDFTGYPPMTIHYSKNEALASDALRVAVKNLQAGQKTDVYCLMNMHHVPHVFGPWLASSYQSTALMIEHLDGFYKE